MPKRGSIPHVKRVRDRYGKVRFYFDTGAKNARGKIVYRRMPDIAEPNWGNVYAALKAARTRRADIAPEFLVPDLIRLYEKSPEFRGLSKGSQTTYGFYLAKLAEEFDKAPARSVERRDIYALIDGMADRPAAANMALTVARNIWTWGAKRDHVSIDPTAGIEMFDGGEYEPWPESLLSAALASTDPKVQRPAALLYYTAQRIGDACLMRWTDIRDGALNIIQQKTGKEMVIPIHRDLRVILDAMPRLGLTILAESESRGAQPPTVRGRLQRFAKKLGHKVVPHGLRKNAVNALLESGCSTGETSSISGQSLAMVEHYAKRRDNRKMASAAILRWERTNEG